jgi:hypothetical protein
MTKNDKIYNEIFLLKRGNHDEIVKYIVDHYDEQFAPQTEVLLFARKDFWEMNEYLSRHSLSPEGQIQLIKNGEDSMIQTYLLHYQLHPKAKTYLAEVGSHKLVLQLLDDKVLRTESGAAIVTRNQMDELIAYAKNYWFKPADEARFVKVSHLPEFLYYVERHGLSPKSEAELLASGDHKKIMGYLLRNLVDKSNEITALEHCTAEELDALLAAAHLGTKAEEFLLDNFSSEVVMPYIVRTGLSSELTLEKFIKRGKTREIVMYITLHNLPEPAELLLLQVGHHEEILRYIQLHGLRDKAQLELVKRCNNEENNAFRRKQQFCPEAVELLKSIYK